MLMNDLSKTRIIILLTDSSQKVTDTEMQDAYDEFIRWHSNNWQFKR